MGARMRMLFRRFLRWALRCDQCNGKGGEMVEITHDGKQMYPLTCWRCKGDGYYL